MENSSSDSDIKQYIKQCLQILDENPYNIVQWILLSSYYFEDDQSQLAINAADYAIAINPESGDAHLAKAVAANDLDNYEMAIQEAHRALEYHCTEEDHAYIVLGDSNLAMKHWQSSYDSYLQALNSITQTSDEEVFIDIQINMALCKARLHSYSEAHERWQNVQEKFPQRHVAFVLEACLYIEEGLLHEAEALLDGFLSLNKDTYMDIALVSGDCFMRYFVFDKALKYYQYMLDKEPNNLQACNRLSMIGFMKNDKNMLQYYFSQSDEKQSMTDIIDNIKSIIDEYEESGLTDKQSFVEKTKERINYYKL